MSAAALSAVLGEQGAVSTNNRFPNIVWILAEDICPDLACYGTPEVKTTNLDKLASQGIRFTNAFATSPVCSALRSTMITGMYQTSIPFIPVFFTLVTDFRKIYFSLPQLNIQITECLKVILEKACIAIPVYCLMPDHLHFIIYVVKTKKNILNMVNYFRSNSSKIGKIFGIKKLWQRRYYDHIIRKDESLKEISVYVYNNPIRKGLTENSDDYKYSEIRYDLLNI